MIYQAILVACLVSAPTDCRHHEMLIKAIMPVAAYVEAQFRAAQWVSEHPGMQMMSLVVMPGRGV